MYAGTDNTGINILKILNSDPSKGLEIILDMHGGGMKTICKNILGMGRTEDIEECISDVLTEIWRNRDRIDLTKGSLKSYIYGMTRHKAIDRRRALDRKAEGEQRAEELDFVLTEDIDMTDELAKRKNAKIVQETVDSLPTPDREIFILRYFMFEKVKNIAERLDIPVKTVENKLSRGKNRLQKELIERGIIL